MDSALAKVRSVLPRERQDYLDRLERSTAVVSRTAATIPRLSSEALTPIQRALAERRVLGLDYQGGQRLELTRRQVEPLGLVYYSDNWHLIAYCRLRRDVRDFRTDRIVMLHLQNELFSGHDDFSLKQYLESRRDEERFEMARIRFKPIAMDRVRRERAWGLVEEQSSPEGIDVTLLDYSLEWLACWILSFGSLAEALEPERLRELVAADAQKIAAKYAAAPPLAPSVTTRPPARKTPRGQPALA
jgi:predicted DNA-binding transcriptional regulator YafY